MKKAVIISLSVALSLTLVDRAFGNTQTQKSEPTKAVKAEVETPLCYLQTPDGKTWDLNNLCEPTARATNPSRTNVATTNPYNQVNIKNFDDDLYGN